MLLQIFLGGHEYEDTESKKLITRNTDQTKNNFITELSHVAGDAAPMLVMRDV